jgi:quinol-cytochrome oxidoreductase complex cytochrome b subunit
MLIALYFVFSPYLFGIDTLKENPNLIFIQLNRCLIFMGLGVSFSSLQDTTKTQNKLSKDVWENPRKGKIVIIIMSLLIFYILTMGLIGYLNAVDGFLNDLSIGLIVLGLGMFGFLKAAIEMYENHRKDKNHS